MVRLGAFFMSLKLPLNRGANLFLGASLSAILAAIYWPGLHGAFFFDDGPSILLAPGVRLGTFSWEGLLQAWSSGGAGPSGRPIAQLTFALNYFFSGFDPFAFKATNLVIHGMCGVFVFCIVHRLQKASNPRASSELLRVISAVVTFLWLLHPIQLLPVLHVVQRMTTLAALFTLAAFWLYILGRERGGRLQWCYLTTAWFGLWPLSFMSKEIGVLFPLFVLAWELTIRQMTVGRLDAFARALAWLSSLVVVAIVAYLLSDRSRWLWVGYEMRDFTMFERLLTEGRVLWFYLGLILLPRLSAFGLYHDDFPVSQDWLTPWTTLPAALGLAVLLGFAWHVRKSSRLATFGIVWFFIGHALESSILPLEVAHEHRNYLPLFGILLAAAALLTTRLQRNQEQRRISLVLGLIALLAVGSITALRSHQFGEEIRRTRLAAHYQPESAQTQFEAGSALVSFVQTHPQLYDTARQYFFLSNELNRSFKMASLGLILLNCEIGRSPETKDVVELARRLRSTPFGPGDRNVLYEIKELSNNGTLCLTRQAVDDLFTAAVENPTASAPVRAMIFSWHTDYLWMHERDIEAARRALTQSLELDPTNLSSRLKWAQLLIISGEHAAARALLFKLRSEKFSTEERKTLEGLLATMSTKPQ